MLAEGMDIVLKAGEIVGIAGASGSGKTTLLRCAAGLEDPAAGEILLEGHLPAELGWPRYRREAVLLSQQPALLEATVEENLARVFSYSTSDEAFPREEALKLLDTLGIEQRRMDQDARSLSVGQQQRVSLVRALLLRPKVLLLDEPASALDEAAVTNAEQLIQDAIREERCQAALWVSHDRDQLSRVSAHVVDLAEYAPKPARGAA